VDGHAEAEARAMDPARPPILDYRRPPEDRGTGRLHPLVALLMAFAGLFALGTAIFLAWLGLFWLMGVG
jgi:hypothetical protein